MSPVGASIYCSPLHRLRSRLTRRPATGICRLGFRVGELYHGEDMVNRPPLICYKYGVAFITELTHIIRAVRLNDKILKRLKRAGTNRVFTRSDFLDLGSTHAIGMAIQRLLEVGKLRRVARGLYDIPRKHPLLGELSASSDAIAAAIARRDGIRLQTTEAAAANLLNLSEQVPGRIVYDADRRRRSVKVGQRTIEFRERSRRKMAAGQTSGLVMAGLRAVGRQHVTPERLAHLRKLLKPADRRRLLQDLRYEPAWMHAHLRFIAGEKKPA